MSAAESAASQNSPAPSPVMVGSNAVPRFLVRAYAVEGSPLLPTNTVIPLLSKYTGPNVSLDEMVGAASDLQLEYRKQGYSAISVAFVPEHGGNGIVTLNVAQTAIPMIMVSGERYIGTPVNAMVEGANNPLAAAPVPLRQRPGASGAVTNAPPPIRRPIVPATPDEAARARADLVQKMAELDAEEKDTRIHVVSTNAGPRFEVERYMISGNSILTPAALGGAITNIDGAYGTNVSFEGIQTVVGELGKAYHDRGYVRVVVGLPQQKLTNATVKLQVLEGRLAAINVVGNRYFSSNNVMRALPGLRTNMVLNGPVFNAELNRANASQDRTIYPVIGPGPEPGTSDLELNVKDRLPLHAKTEFNNENSPGTPDLRVNSSAVYDNLWQQEHSLGIQYGFSPELYKSGNQWPFYDGPQVANYSGFYRLPMGNPEPLEERIAANPGSFGYDEATRKFNLPPSSGQPDLTLFASRSTVDTGLTTTYSGMITATGSNPSISRQDVQDSPTVNQDIGARLTFPLPASPDFQSGFSGGMDFKTYQVGSYKTNNFLITQTNYNTAGLPILPPDVSTVASPVPATVNYIEYLPLTLRYDGSWRTETGTTAFGLGLTFNPWFSSDTTIGTGTNTTYLNGVKSLQQITGSTKSSGHWVVLNPTFSRTFGSPDSWLTTLLLDGQWASEPLISTEQFGIGGVNSVRGYHEGEVFGDTGWHFSMEQQTPPHVVGMVHGSQPLTIRGSVYMDYAKAYLLDPQGRPNDIALWGAGLGLTASVGSHWDARLLFSVPLLNAGTVSSDQLYFNFSLTAQF